MKIDYIAVGYWPVVGGTETILKNIAERMAQRGHDVTVHTSTYNPNYLGKLKNEDVVNGVKIRRYLLLPFYIFFPKIKNPQVIHLFSYGDNFIFQSLLHHSNILVSSPIGEEIYSYGKIRSKLLGPRILDYSRIIFAMTTYERNQLSKLYKLSLDKIVVWPAGVGEEAFSEPNMVNVKGEISKISRTKYYVRLARLDRFKKIEFGIQLLEHLPNFNYIVVGTLDNTSYLEELKELSKRIGVEDRVVFIGKPNDDEKRLLMRNSQFYLIANRESFGIATIEAMAQGAPIVAPDIDEYTDIVIDQVNSLIYKYYSIDSCVESVNRLLQDESLRRNLGENGKIIARERFLWDRIADVAENYYRSLINEQSMKQ